MKTQHSLRAARLRGLRLAPALTLALAVPAAGQEAFALDPVFLAKSKRAVATDTATATTSVDESEIGDRQAGTIAQLIDSVPGVALINGTTPQGSGINIRGFGANSTNGSDQKVAIQVDGASVGSEELYRIGTQLFTDPELYKEVTVIRGIAGTFEYGSGIIGGLVKLETRDASDFTGGKPGFRLRQTLQYGTNGHEFASSTILAWQPTETFELLGNVTWRKMGVQTDGAGQPIGSNGFELPSYALKGKWSFGASQYLSFSATDTNSDERDVPYDTFGTTGGSFGNVDRKTHARTVALTYGLNPADAPLLDLTATLSYADQKIDSQYIPGSSPLEGTPAFAGLLPLVNADHRYRTWKLNVKNRMRFATGGLNHDLRIGVEAIRKTRLEASSAPGGTDRRLAVFAVDDLDAGSGLTLTPALRYERQKIGGPSYDQYTNDALMGGLSAYKRLGGGWAVFGSLAYTENLPILDDLTTPAYMTRAEKARSIEIGAAFDRTGLWRDGDDFSIKANIYRNVMWDITSYTTASRAPLTNADFHGLELESSYAMASGPYMDLNLNIARGRSTTPALQGDWEGIPADSLRLTLGKRWGERVDLSWEMVVADSMPRTTTPTAGYGVHNLRATYRPEAGVWAGTEIRIGVENLFDRAYTPHLATRPAPGRTLKLTLARSF